MKLKLGQILCKECLQKVQAVQLAQDAEKKLRKRNRADGVARNRWKKLIAKGMRAAPTKHEAIMGDLLKSVGFSYETQKQIGPYIADFYIPPHLVIEVDGSVHDKQKYYDASRDAFMERKGYKVLRIKNEELTASIESLHEVSDRISEFMGAR